MPFGSGTLGSLLAAGIYIFFLSPLPIYIQIIIVLTTCALGIISSTKIEKDYGKDASCIIIDEVVGMWVTYLFLPAELWVFILGLILFRIFDIVKPLYINRLQHLKGGWGVMLDDIAAAIYSNLIMQLINYYYV